MRFSAWTSLLAVVLSTSLTAACRTGTGTTSGVKDVAIQSVANLTPYFNYFDTSVGVSPGQVVRASCPVLVGIVQDVSQIRSACTVVSSMPATTFYRNLQSAWSNQFNGGAPMPATALAVLGILESQLQNASGTHFTAPDLASDSLTYRQLIAQFDPIFAAANPTPTPTPGGPLNFGDECCFSCGPGTPTCGSGLVCTAKPGATGIVSGGTCQASGFGGGGVATGTLLGDSIMTFTSPINNITAVVNNTISGVSIDVSPGCRAALVGAFFNTSAGQLAVNGNPATPGVVSMGASTLVGSVIVQMQEAVLESCEVKVYAIR